MAAITVAWMTDPGANFSLAFPFKAERPVLAKFAYWQNICIMKKHHLCEPESPLGNNPVYFAVTEEFGEETDTTAW